MNRTIASVVALVACSIGLGCATAQVPQSKIDSSSASIRNAEAAGAVNEPRARVHLGWARDQHARGLQLIKQGENEEAGLMLSRAQSDAEVASALASEANTRGEAARMLTEISILREKL